MITATQCRAARALLDWSQQGLADRLAWDRYGETIGSGQYSAPAGNAQRHLEGLKSAGVEFIDENGGGPGVRLRKRHRREARWRPC